jgi:hypothetical protein
MERASTALSHSLLESLCHHVALPAQLPHRREGNLEEIETALANLLLNACNDLKDLTRYDRFGPHWDCIRGAIKTARLLNAGGKLDSNTLLTAFCELDGNQILIIHVSEQNAGLLIRRVER